MIFRGLSISPWWFISCIFPLLHFAFFPTAIYLSESFLLLLADYFLKANFSTILCICLPVSSLTPFGYSQSILFFFFFFFFLLFRAAPTSYEHSKARGQIGAADLHHSHSNAGSKLSLQTYTSTHCKAGSLPTEQGQGSKPPSHEY